MNKTTNTASFSDFSRRDFIVTGGKVLVLGVAGTMLAYHCTRNDPPVESNVHPVKYINTKPLKIGFIGENSHFEFYAEALKKIPYISFDLIDRESAFHGQVEAVIIAAPLSVRAKLAIQFLKAGSHVLVETPMTTSYEEFDAIVWQANQQNKRLAVTYFHRFLKSANQARALINEMGKIKKVSIKVNELISEPLLSRQQEGFIKGLPLLDLVRWLLAKSPVSLHANENKFAQFNQAEKNLYLTIQLKKIPLSYSTISRNSPDGDWTIIFYGHKECLKLSAKRGLAYRLQRTLADDNQWETILDERPSDYKEAVLGLLEDFVEACQTGKEPEVNALDGMAGLSFTLAAVQSAQSGQTVSMVEPSYGAEKNKIWLRSYYQQLKHDDKESSRLSSLQRYLYHLIGSGKGCEQIQTGDVSHINGLNPLKIADRIAQDVMARHEHYSSYTTDIALEGLLYLFDASGQEKYLDHVLKVWQFRAKENADSLDWKILFVCLHFEIFLRTGNKSYIETFMDVAKDFQKNVPRDSDGAVAYWIRPKKKRIFIDMLQGYAIFMARAGWLSGDVSFFNECVNQYQIYRNILRNPKTGLWHQGRGWGPTSHHISPGHWNRGQGWVFRGMVESLCYLPESYSKQPLMLKIMRELADSLITYQDSRGLWHQITDYPAAYQETSGTAMFVHYLYKAIQNGWLPKEIFLPVAAKGLGGLLGFVHKNGLVSNTSHGSGPLMTLEGYLHRPSVPGDGHSKGITLMACAAPYLSGTYSRLKAGPNNFC